MTGLTIGSLFAGIGGFDLAGEWCGHRTIWTSEIDPYCVTLLAERFPEAKQLGDITAIDWAHVERPDILTGGFPCQDISYAGKGAGLAGKRSGLWYEYARAIREVGPRYVIVENVRALFTRGFDAVLGTLADLGYDAEWSMYGSADVGAPHRRHRVWILAYRNSGGRRKLGQRHDTHRADVDRGGPCLDDATGARCGVGRPVEGGPARHEARREGSDGRRGSVVHPTSGGRGTGTSQSARRADGGCERLGDAERPSSRGGTGSLRGAETQGDFEWGQDGRGVDGPRVASNDVGDTFGQRRQERQPSPLATDAGWVGGRGGAVGWSDAVPVRGHDGTVRLIPRQAAEEGPESSLWPVADGVPGRVARLRGIGNAITPWCALPIFGRIAELEAGRAMRVAA